MTDSLAATQSVYGRWARVYDLVATAPGVQSWRRRAAETLDLLPGDTVIEMGCGTGANFPFLRNRVGANGRVVGVDLVPAMLDRARHRIARKGWENVHVARGDATQPPVATADAVLSTFLVGMLDDPGAAVRTWCDLLTADGRLTLLNAVRSDRAIAVPLNVVFRLFVRLTAPGGRGKRRSPAKTLETRWETARQAVRAETTAHVTEEFALGFVSLVGGRAVE